jgi:Ca2+-binding EF-hand superfamily protein
LKPNCFEKFFNNKKHFHLKKNFNFFFSVSEEELKRLWRRFKKLDKDNSNSLTTNEFKEIPELASNPLLERVIAIFDTNKDDEIEFNEFINALATFSVKGNLEAKLKCKKNKNLAKKKKMRQKKRV